jgi:hypothetical protein
METTIATIEDRVRAREVTTIMINREITSQGRG